MSESVTRLLDLFDALPEADKQTAVAEILRRRPLGEADIPAEGFAALAGELFATNGPATLADLLAGITPDNLHGEWSADSLIGIEQPQSEPVTAPAKPGSKVAVLTRFGIFKDDVPKTSDGNEKK